MKLTKEVLRQIIKEEIESLGLSEIENVEEVAGVGGGISQGRPRTPRRMPGAPPDPAPSAAASTASAQAGGETTMEIGQIEDIKSRLDALIAQSGNQIVGKVSMLLKMLDAEMANQGLGTKGDYRKQRGTPSQRRTKARHISTKGKGSGAGIGLSERKSKK